MSASYDLLSISEGYEKNSHLSEGVKKKLPIFRVGGGGCWTVRVHLIFFFLRGLKSTYLILMGVGCGYEMERPLSEWY